MARTAGTANGADLPRNPILDDAITARSHTCSRASHRQFDVAGLVRNCGRGIYRKLLASTAIWLVNPIIDCERDKAIRSKIGRNPANLASVAVFELTAKNNQHGGIPSWGPGQINVPFERKIRMRPVGHNSEFF